MFLKIKMKRLFHISKNCLDGKTLNPNIPDNEFTKRGIENNSIPRICFAPTVNQCLLALGIDKYKDRPEPEIYFIHEPIDYYNLEIISNEEIVKNNYVPNAEKTKETWVIEPCEVECVGIIII